MLVRSPLLAVLLIFAMSACSPQNEDSQTIIDASNTVEPSSIMPESLDGSADIECFDDVISGNWHDDPELDPSTVVSMAQSNQAEMTQSAIDTLIDITLLSDETCSVVVESTY
jgi:hypothetical protein